MPVRVDAIPDDLKRLNQWVLWKWKWNGKKWDKPPLQRNGSPAKSNDPTTWISFDNAVEASQRGYDGIGFVFSGDDSFVGIDLDDCHNRETGELTPQADYIIRRLDSYAEVSPSGCGVKIIVTGAMPPGRKADHKTGVEIYASGRYFTITGNQVPGTPSTIHPRNVELHQIHQEFLGDKPQPAGERSDDRELALSALAGLAPHRADHYSDWLAVGMALHSLDSSLLPEWESWSRQSDKFVPGECARKWATFDGQGVGIASLFHWAKNDGWQYPRPSANGSVNGRHNEDFISTPGSWPDPKELPSELLPVETFDFGLLPWSLEPWIRDIADRVQCPPDFPAVGAMVSLAAVVGRKLGIRPKKFDDWLVVPNLWGAVIGRPGIMKTPALQEVVNPIRRLEIAAAETFKEQQKDMEAAQMVDKERKKAAERDIKSALKRREDAYQVARAILDEEPERFTRRRYMTNDPSVEKLGEILNENPNGIQVFRDELMGLLKSLDKEGREGSRAFYLEAWNGTGRYTYDRIGRGTLDIEATILSILGGIQPGPLSEYLQKAAQNGAGDDGLLQRFQLMVWPDISAKWKNVDRWPDTDARRTAYSLFQFLDDLDPQSIGAETDEYGDIPFRAVQFRSSNHV